MTEHTRARLLAHRKKYPSLLAEDVCKFLYQSAFGCEHLLASEEKALAYITEEWKRVPREEAPLTEMLDGDYARAHLSWLHAGLSPATLARLFCASAKKESEGMRALRKKLSVAKALFRAGLLGEDPSFEEKLAGWEREGCPALHHSEAFRLAYRPAYRVISRRFAPFLPVFALVDRLLSQKGTCTLAVEGGCGSGKTTLSEILREIYGAAVFHMDDFFLRPSQRTPERLREVGGNVDRERFLSEVLLPLSRGEEVTYRPFDCSLWDLGAPVSVPPAPLTVVEGVYSMHPLLSSYYDGAVFLRIAPDYQKERIEKRNSPAMATRFFEEWIPLENQYFSGMEVESRCDLTIPVERA